MSIPAHWRLKSIGDVAEILSGNSINSQKKTREFTTKEKGSIPYIATKDVGFDHLINYDNGIYIPSSNKDKFRIAPANSILVCSEGGSAGKKIAITDRLVHYVNKLYAITAHSDILEYRYVYYWCLSAQFKADFLDSMTGLIGGVSKNKFSKIKIPVPPIEEQREILVVLDSAFAKIDAALANVRQNIINSNELFQSKLTQIFSNSEPNWNTSSLIDACLKITDGSHFSPKDTEYNEYPYITVRDISNNIINFEDCKTIKEVDYLDLVKNNCKPQKGDVLFSKDGTVGKVSLIDYEKEFVVLSSLAIIRPKQEIVLPELLKWILLDPKFVKEAVGKKTGTAIRRIILKNLKEITIRYPKNLKSQRELVERIGSLEGSTEMISKKYKTEEASLLELKKSLLQKAFSGELTVKKV